MLQQLHLPFCELSHGLCGAWYDFSGPKLNTVYYQVYRALLLYISASNPQINSRTIHTVQNMHIRVMQHVYLELVYWGLIYKTSYKFS